MSATIQDRLEIESIEDGIGLFGTSDLARSVAILDVVGADASLATADDATQEEILAGRAQFLNAQMAPFQVVVRAEQVDLEGHLRRVRDRAELLPEPLARWPGTTRPSCRGLVTVARSWTAIATSSFRTKNPLPPQRWADGFAGYWVADSSDGLESAAISAEVGRRLRFRCDQVSRQLGRSGLTRTA